MFGKILKFDNSRIYLENLRGVADTNYIGYHVVFPEQEHKIVGEIVAIDAETITILLIGELVDGKFTNGVLKKPGIDTPARIIFKSEIECILGKQNYMEKGTLLIGNSPVYKDYIVSCDMNDFFANHFAILGNTGAGKSCGVARIIQNVFFTGAESTPRNAHFAIFDAYGEYYNTFNDMERFNGLHAKKVTTQISEFIDGELLRIPAYFLEDDDLAILLGASSATQLPVLRKALELVKIFTSHDPRAEEYKNNIIASVLLDILSSGNQASQVRDQAMSVLTNFNTPTLNLNSILHQPGYDRTFLQCLNIDAQGKINAIQLIIQFLQGFKKVDIDKIVLTGQPMYTLPDLYAALEFALISEGSLTSETQFDRNNILKSRLQTIIESTQAYYFQYDGLISQEDYVRQFFTINGQPAQLVDINLSYIDDKFAKALTKIFAKLFFKYTTTLEQRGTYPIHILLEEAHRYVQHDTDIEIIGYNIFDRITKEGRKYGTIIGFITQKPSELSKTALSQCSNFVVFRLFYPEDLGIVKGISSNVTDETIEQIKTLHPGMGLVFGTAFKIPLLAGFPLPNPLPVSTSLDVSNVWYQ